MNKHNFPKVIAQIGISILTSSHYLHSKPREIYKVAHSFESAS